MQIHNPRCAHLGDPCGLGDRNPVLTWELRSKIRGDTQTAWQVSVSSRPNGRADLWDSGKVAGGETVGIVYGGTPLSSRQRCWWSVRVWDALDRASEPATGSWEMGLLEPGDWQASWVAAPPALRELEPSPEALADLDGWRGLRPVHLAGAFTVGSPVARARAYVTARGLYDLWLNGTRVGADLLRPGWTDYHQRIQVQTYDVTSLLRQGDNAVGVHLGTGWYAGRVFWLERVYGDDRPSALVQLELTHDDGSVIVFGSDGTWLAQTSPLLWSDLMKGEALDAASLASDWAAPEADRRGWLTAEVVPAPTVPLVATAAPGVRRLMEIEPRDAWVGPDGQWIVDMGQNMVGRVRIRLDGPAGAVVRLRHAEVLEPDGRLHTANLRSARATDVVVLAGTEIVYEPTFTTHGFRYVEVTGLAGPPESSRLVGVVLGSDLPQVAEFSCSSELVTQLQRNIEWGQRGNHLEVPTDCPQRDERLGWTGDAQAFVSTAAMNADLTAFYDKWLTDLMDTQQPDGAFGDVAPLILPELFASASAGWGDAGTVVPTTLFQHYGDHAQLARCYPAMVAWVDRLHRLNPDLLWRHGRGNDYGDWVPVDADTPQELVASAFLAHSTDLVARAARVLGRDEEAAHYAEIFGRACAAFCGAYVAPSGRVYGATQTSYVLPLAFGLVPPDKRPALAGFLVADIARSGEGEFMATTRRRPPWHLSTGFLGIRDLLPVLTDAGYLDVAYRLLENETFPSWGYSIRQGATTIWERWDAYTVEDGIKDGGMNSFNHYCFGSVGQWLFSTVAGIAPAPDAVGFDRIVVRPRPGGSLTWAAASHRSVRGEIATSWRLLGDRVELDVRIPCNARAEVWVPATAGVTEGGLPLAAAPGVTVLGQGEGETRVAVGGGEYRFAGAR